MSNVPEEQISQEAFNEMLVQQKQDDPAKTLMELADDLATKKVYKESLEGELRDVNRAIDEKEMAMVDIMAALELPSFKHGGKTFYQYVQSHPRIINEEGFFALLKEYGEDGIIKRTVHPQTLKAWVKEKGLEWSERFAGKLEIFEKVKIGVRKA